MRITKQKVSFRRAKACLSDGKRHDFAMQKDTNRKTAGTQRKEEKRTHQAHGREEAEGVRHTSSYNKSRARTAATRHSLAPVRAAARTPDRAARRSAAYHNGLSSSS